MMMSYQQQAELARLQHEARLQEAAQARRIAHLRQRRTVDWAAWLGWLWPQRRGRGSQAQPVRTDRIAAIRHQTS
ncbi:MAG: hypothetical protein DYG89_35305 [Caldilinea sp. CFX5]|nr:hypothetical protein [Caldilinea sp. CFX5]